MNNSVEKILIRILAVSLFAALPVIAVAQLSIPKPPFSPDPKEHAPEVVKMHGGDTSERSIVVDKNVNLSLCVTQGKLKVNGWNRGEVRVFVKDGAKFGFKVQLKSPKTGLPALIMLAGAESKGKYATPSECIWGEEIEIDVPVNATVNIKGQETKTTIDTVRKASVKTIGGDIDLRNVAEGITAVTYEGDVTVEASQGAMFLESTTGNILVFEASPSEIGDIFKAKTNSGSISLQQLQHRQIEVNSISGSVSYIGTLLNGGTYGLSTSNGSIKMAIPADSSCQVIAFYGFGGFNSEIPLKIEQENIYEGPMNRIVGKLGNGGCTLKLTTNNGRILIVKP